MFNPMDCVKYENPYVYGTEADCLVCGTRFVKVRKHQVYCCSDCREIAVRERSRNYYNANRDEINRKRRDGFQTDPRKRQKHREQNRKYYYRHKQESLKRGKKWRDNNREYSNYLQRLRRCSKKNNNCDPCPYNDCKVAVEYEG